MLRNVGRRSGWSVVASAFVAGLAMATAMAMAGSAAAQEDLVDRPAPPPLDDLETDANNDGIPDGWYNARDVSWVAKDGRVGPHFLRFHATTPGGPARISRAFGVDGRKAEAILLGLWIRQLDVQIGDRNGSEPTLLIQFYGEAPTGGVGPTLARGQMGPWTHPVGNRWTRVVKRIPVPPGARDAILSTGLMGATGTLEIDGLTVELVPTGGAPTTNLIVNGDFELGDPAPTYWTSKDAHRTFPGNDGSSSALELTHNRAFAMAGLALPVNRFDAIDLSIAARCAGLRGVDAATATVFFLDRLGRPIVPPGQELGEPVLRWSGTAGWAVSRQQVPVPPGAVRAVLQINKADGAGSIRVDDVQVTGLPNAQDGTWTPFHVEDDTTGWLPVPAAPEVQAGGALDVSFLLPKPAGRDGAVSAKDGRLAFGQGGRARFLGVSLMPQTSFLEPERADALADRLARSGINLVRFSDLDMPLGPGRSLYDDARDDTKVFDPESLARFDHLIAALKARGIYVAIELQSSRRFRSGDGVANPGLLPDGGGPAAMIDPTIGKLAMASARALLDRVNPETGLALREDPVLAWVTLAGEISLFDQLSRPDALPASYGKILRERAAGAPGGSAGRRLWEWLEADHLREMAEDLRRAKVRAPIAGVSHWRREREFAQAQAAPGLDLIDDRIFWMPAQEWASPEVRSMLWNRDGGLAGTAAAKRRPDRPYVVGQWCNQTFGAWAFPTEAADYLLGVYTAAAEDWDGLVRRGVFIYPQTWGDGPSGTVGGEDIFQIAEVLNGSPHVLALLPHAASLFHRGVPARAAAARHPARGQRGGIAGWDPARGRLVIDTPFTQALAGWPDGAPARFPRLELAADNEFAVLAATSIGPEPIEKARRLLVTAVGRVEPTGFRWVDSWKMWVADPGRPPLLREPVKATITWRRKGSIRAFALGPNGERAGTAKVEPLPDGEGATLVLDGRAAGFHWELVAD